MPRIMNELQTSPPQEQETSARAKLIEARRRQTGGHNKSHMNSRNDRISRNTRIAKEQKENKKEETSEGRKEEEGPEKHNQPTLFASCFYHLVNTDANLHTIRRLLYG